MEIHNSNFLKNEKIWMLLIVLLYFSLILPQIQKPFVMDEIDFPEAANAINTKGVPMYYSGEGDENHLGLWHPPLYIYVLALSFRLFGVSEASARLVSVLFSLGTLFLIYYITKEIFYERKDKEYINKNCLCAKCRYISLLSCFLYVINPFVIQNSLLIDIDNSILTFLLTLFIFAFVKTIKTKNSNNLLLLGLLFGLSLWSKFGTSPALIISIFAFYVLNKGIKSGVMHTVIIFVIGIIFFLTTWGILSEVTGMPFAQPFMHNIKLLSEGASSSIIHYIASTLWGAKTIFFWTTPFMGFLIIMALLKRLKKYLMLNEFTITDFLLVYGLLVFIEYTAIRPSAYGFPKYYGPMMPAFSIVVASYVYECCIHNFTRNKTNDLLIYGTVLIISILYFLFVLGDPFIIDTNLDKYQIVGKTTTIFVLYIIPLGIALVCLRIFTQEHKISKLFVLYLTILLISASLSLSYLQSQANYSTAYLYGQTGMQETIDYILTHTTSNDTIISPKDLAYYTKNPFYETNAHLLNNPERFYKIIYERNIPYIVMRSKGAYIISYYPHILGIINSDYSLVAKFGYFNIYKQKNMGVKDVE